MRICLWSQARCLSYSFIKPRPSSPAPSVDRDMSSFSSISLHAPYDAHCEIDGLFTLVWQMLFPIVNVASLDAMIHGPEGICSSEETRGLLYLRLNFMCSSAQGTLHRFVSGLVARVCFSWCKILQLEIRSHRSRRQRHVGRWHAVVYGEPEEFDALYDPRERNERRIPHRARGRRCRGLLPWNWQANLTKHLLIIRRKYVNDWTLSWMSLTFNCFREASFFHIQLHT